MRRNSIIFLGSMLISLHCFAQKDIDEIISKSGTFKLNIKEKPYEKKGLGIPFNKLIIIDERFDTTKLAYRHRNKFLYDKVKLPGKWDDILNKRFIDVLDSVSVNTLVIVVRTFWMMVNNSDPLPRHKVDEIGLGVIEEFITALDVYSYSANKYKALFRIENNNQFVLRDYLTDDERTFFFIPFDSVITRLLNSDIIKLTAGKKNISPYDFESYYIKRKSIPVLNGQTINKGLYMTFEEFKENRPSKLEYTVNKGKSTDEVYIIKNGKEELLVNFWGIYDGNELLIKFGLNLFVARRQNSTYEIYGGRDIKTRYFGGGAPISSEASRFQSPIATGNKIIKKMMQLNMDDGKWY